MNGLEHLALQRARAELERVKGKRHDHREGHTCPVCVVEPAAAGGEGD